MKMLSVNLLNFSYPLVLSYIFGAQKNRLIETVLLSTHNICFGWEIRKLIFCYTLLTKGLVLRDEYILIQILLCMKRLKSFGQSDSLSNCIWGHLTHTGGKPRNYHEIVLT